jgi:hypothetical protein
MRVMVTKWTDSLTSQHGDGMHDSFVGDDLARSRCQRV